VLAVLVNPGAPAKQNHSASNSPDTPHDVQGTVG
jgi:hypothetical protein